jgi:hypothetical protein
VGDGTTDPAGLDELDGSTDDEGTDGDAGGDAVGVGPVEAPVPAQPLSRITDERLSARRRQLIAGIAIPLPSNRTHQTIGSRRNCTG